MNITYTVVPIILIAVVLAAVLLERWSVPVILIALGAGIVFGSDVLNLWHFDNILLAKEVANIALVFILFHGGFSTKSSSFKKVALPAAGLASWGVILTALTTFLVLHFLLNWSTQKALLLAAIVSSTDAAAIFSILRRQPLPDELSSLVEIESATNDPMAILLVVAAIDAFSPGYSDSGWTNLILSFAWKFLTAPIFGWLMGKVAVWLFNRVTPQDRGHYYVLTIGIILLIYGVSELVGASGMLAVFAAGYVMGNRPFVHRQGVMNFSAALSTIANIGMFVLLGLQVFPRQFINIWSEGILLFLIITFLSRPCAVWLGTIGMRLGWRNKTFITWAGLRGTVPIVLAIYPAAAGMAIGDEVFNLVFFTVLLSILIQGSTLGPMARLLKLNVAVRPKPLFNLELFTMAASDLDLIVIDLPGPQHAFGKAIADLRLPTGAVITLITRGKDLIVPRGTTHLQGWDQVTVLASATEHKTIRSILLEALLSPTDSKKDDDPEIPRLELNRQEPLSSDPDSSD